MNNLTTTIAIFTKEILSHEFNDLIEFDRFYLIEGSEIPAHDAPPVYTLEEIQTAKNRGDEIYWLCNSEEERVGYYWTEKKAQMLCLSALVIATPFRGKKIGRQVLHWVECYARTHGLKQCSLAVSSLNSPALRLYHSYGYQVVRDEQNYFGDVRPNISRLIMEKTV